MPRLFKAVHILIVILSSELASVSEGSHRHSMPHL
jgi:hypothetical protein